MASIIPNSLFRDVFLGNVNLQNDTFNMTLHTSAYVPDKDLDLKFSDVGSEVTGTGYTAGGKAVDISVGAQDNANDRVDISIPGTNWTGSTITARYAVVRKARGGAATADELVCIIDFGGDVISVNGTFTVTASTIRVPTPPNV